jgi:hypothetical protein
MVKRGRNEGTLNVPASNVIGNSNITIYTAALGQYGDTALVEPTIGAVVGISDLIELQASTSFTNFQGLGTTKVRIRATSPWNDHLRFFGISVSGDLYLTTAADTSTRGSTGKPDYSSYTYPYGIIDLDWLAVSKNLPLKTYFSFGMVEEPDKLFRYDQVSGIAGIEWKMYENSFFCDIGIGLYKERSQGSFPGDPNYAQKVVWFEPGARYRLYGKYSLMGSFRVSALQWLKPRNPLKTNPFHMAVAMEIPLLFSETNSEAIRTMIFVEHKKHKHKSDSVARNMEQGRHVENKLEKDLRLLNLKSEISDHDQEISTTQKKEDIQRKMDEIEKLLDESQ